MGFQLSFCYFTLPLNFFFLKMYLKSHSKNEKKKAHNDPIDNLDTYWNSCYNGIVQFHNNVYFKINSFKIEFQRCYEIELVYLSTNFISYQLSFFFFQNRVKDNFFQNIISSYCHFS